MNYLNEEAFQTPCTTEENQKIFMSPYVSRFDKRDLEDAGASPKEIKLQQKIHATKRIEYIKKAKEVCNECPFIKQCLAYSDKVDDRIYGVVAGMSEPERKKRLIALNII